MKVLDLFSGIGGFSLGLERAGMETVAFCEIDPFCRKVLAKHWPEVPIHDDITRLDGTAYRGTVDVVCGGFPCQPFSSAGKRRGTDDDRHLWPEMLRVIREVEPRFVIGENVVGLIGMELDAVLSDLEALGYACGAFVVPACAVDARHRRDRVWILADRNGDREPDQSVDDEARWGATAHVPDAREIGCGEAVRTLRRGQSDALGRSQDVADTDSQRSQERPSIPGVAESPHGGDEGQAPPNGCWWRPEPNVGRVVDGIPGRVDRLRALGNAVVPQVVEQIGRAVMEAA